MLKNKEKKQLKALANSLKVRYQIGKDNVDDDVLKMLDNALKAHELIKIYFNKNIANEMEKISSILINKLKAEEVGSIGHTIIIYRENLEKKDRIKLN